MNELYTYAPQSNRLLTQNGWTFNRDPAGNRTARLNVGGFGQLYSYADHNRLAQVTLRDSLGDTLAGDYLYDGRGQRAVKTADGVTTHFVYGPSGELLGEYRPGGTSVEHKEYVYLNGMPIAVVGRGDQPLPPTEVEVIVDNDDPGTSSTGSWQWIADAQAYGSDYFLAINAGGASYRWTATPSLYSDVYVRWVEDKSHSGRVTYEIGEELAKGDRILGIVTVSHKNGGGEWHYLGNYPTLGSYVEVTSDHDNFVADAVRWVYLQEQQGVNVESTHYIHFDHLGTPRQVSDEAQNVVWRWDSRPFGDSLPDEDPDGDGQTFTLNLRFPGQYFDAESGLHYNYFRDYDPSMGRYVEPDPVGLAGALNAYAYSRNNALLKSDRLGLFEFSPDQSENPTVPSIEPITSLFCSQFGTCPGQSPISRGPVSCEEKCNQFRNACFLAAGIGGFAGRAVTHGVCTYVSGGTLVYACGVVSSLANHGVSGALVAKCIEAVGLCRKRCNTCEQ